MNKLTLIEQKELEEKGVCDKGYSVPKMTKEELKEQWDKPGAIFFRMDIPEVHHKIHPIL